MPASSSSGSEEKRPPNIDSAAGASDEPLPLTPSPGPDRRCSALGRMLGRRSSSEQSSENGSERTPTPGNRRMSGGRRRNSDGSGAGTSPQGGTPASSVGGSVPRIRRSSNPENQRPGSAGSSTGTSRGSRASPDISSRLIRRASEVGDSVKSFRDLSKSQTLTKAPTVNLIQDVAAKATFVIDPDSKAVKYFYLFLLMALLYNAWMIPFRIAFLQPGEMVITSIYAVDYVCDAIFVLDMLLTCNRGYFDEGNKVMELPSIRRHYFTNLSDFAHPSFVRDLLSVMPFDLLQLGIGLEGATRLNRLLRVPRIFSAIRDLVAGVLGRHRMRIVQLVLLFSLEAHYVACAWMLFARFEGFGTNDWLPPAFLANATLEYKYTRSLYTSLGLIAGVQDGGEPAEIGEGVFHVFVMIMSLLIFAYAPTLISRSAPPLRRPSPSASDPAEATKEQGAGAKGNPHSKLAKLGVDPEQRVRSRVLRSLEFLELGDGFDEGSKRMACASTCCEGWLVWPPPPEDEFVSTHDPATSPRGLARLSKIQFPRINPSSLFRSTWVLATISTILFTTITLPYRLAFIPLPHDAHWGFAVTDAITDIFFATEIVLSFGLAFWSHMVLVTDGRVIASRYAKTLLPLHATSLIPLILRLVLPGDAHFQLHARIPLLLRSIRLNPLITEYARLREHSNFSARKLIQLLFIFFTMAHFIACGRGAVVRAEVVSALTSEEAQTAPLGEMSQATAVALSNELLTKRAPPGSTATAQM